MMITDEILFGGKQLPTKLPQFRKPKDRHHVIVILEKAFLKLTDSDEGKRLYGDPNKGATLEQSWRTSGILTGKWPVCLLATDKPVVSTGAIERVIEMNSNQLIKVLADLYGLIDKVGVQVLYHDGYMGHSITLTGFNSDTSRFTYHDPWPEYSLLCKDYNAAGIDARKEEPGWSITSAELEKVVIASFVFQNMWAEYMGEKYYITYDDLKASEFWSFFNITEIHNHRLDDNKSVFALRPGGFKTEIELNISLNQKARVVEGQLNMKRTWMVGPPYGINPFAVDILRSFIVTMIPPPDKEQISRLVTMLHDIELPAYAKQLICEDPESMFHKALFAYLGMVPSFEGTFRFSSITMSNQKHDDVEWLQTSITTDVL